MSPVSYPAKSRLPDVGLALGIILFVLGAVGFIFDSVSGVPVAGLGLQGDVDLEVAGLVIVAGAVLVDRIAGTNGSSPPLPTEPYSNEGVYVTESLLEALLDRARRREPEPISIGLAVTPAEQLHGVGHLDDRLPVFTHLYLPEEPNPVSAVFGVDLQTPPGRTHGRFITHPRANLELTKLDDLHEVVIVAVPPWDDESVAAFDRRGRRHTVRIVDAVPPEESVPTEDQ